MKDNSRQTDARNMCLADRCAEAGVLWVSRDDTGLQWPVVESCESHWRTALMANMPGLREEIESVSSLWLESGYEDIHEIRRGPWYSHGTERVPPGTHPVRILYVSCT